MKLISEQDPQPGDVFEYEDRSGVLCIADDGQPIQIDQDGVMSVLGREWAFEVKGLRVKLYMRAADLD